MSSETAPAGFGYPLEGIDVSIASLERALWALVAVALVGDIVTTFVGLRFGLVESNPIARGAIESYGVFGMIALKAFALALAFGCRQLLVLKYRPIVPAGLVVPWTVAVAINLYMISTVI